MMYSAAPPPGTLVDTSTKKTEDSKAPVNVNEDQWKRFRSLKARREKECGKAAKHRATSARNKALRAVSKELSKDDKSLLKEEGVYLPPSGNKRKHPLSSEDSKSSHTSCASSSNVLEAEWQEVKLYLDPNPQLRGIDKGVYAPKGKLEKELDSAIEKREFGEAVAISDRLTQRKFAKQVTTAFDCHEYIKKRKIDKERKKTKLKWSFEPKQRWESKGNM